MTAAITDAAWFPFAFLAICVAVYGIFYALGAALRPHVMGRDDDAAADGHDVAS